MNEVALIPRKGRIIDTTAVSRDTFIEANTKAILVDDLERNYVVPVFARTNELTIPHHEFIHTVRGAAFQYFNRDLILKPAVRVSHLVKGRIPEALHKPVALLEPHEVTQYWERVMFMAEIPTIEQFVDGRLMTLVIGGVRALNNENLYTRKTLERFKLFIGFQVYACTNLCVSTDGLLADVRVGSLEELDKAAWELFSQFDVERQAERLRKMAGYQLSERQFAQLVGRLRMFSFLPSGKRTGIPELKLTDAQINQVVKGYYEDEHFAAQDRSISLWKLYNLFTGAVKSTYIDQFLDRGRNATEFIDVLQTMLDSGRSNWYLS